MFRIASGSNTAKSPTQSDLPTGIFRKLQTRLFQIRKLASQVLSRHSFSNKSMRSECCKSSVTSADRLNKIKSSQSIAIKAIWTVNSDSQEVKPDPVSAADLLWSVSDVGLQLPRPISDKALWVLSSDDPVTSDDLRIDLAVKATDGNVEKNDPIDPEEFNQSEGFTL